MNDGKPNPDVWAIGDAATIEDAPLPATSQGQYYSWWVGWSTSLTKNIILPVANQKAKYLVKKLNKIAKDQEFSTPFEFHNQGSLAYIGNWCVLLVVFISSLVICPEIFEGKQFMINLVSQVKRTVSCRRKLDDWLGCCGVLRTLPWLSVSETGTFGPWSHNSTSLKGFP